MPDKILISACLLGERVRYDGGDNRVIHQQLQRWQQENRLVPICPEVTGGLPIPRPPAEISQGDGHSVLQGEARVISIHGDDVTDSFLAGAKAALALAQKHQCRFALLAARSPSCGNNQIYDGHFNGQLVDGAGTTAAMLQQAGIEVFNPEQIDALIERLTA